MVICYALFNVDGFDAIQERNINGGAATLLQSFWAMKLHVHKCGDENEASDLRLKLLREVI